MYLKGTDGHIYSFPMKPEYFELFDKTVRFIYILRLLLMMNIV